MTLTFYNVPADASGSTSCANTVPGQNCKLTLTVNSGTRTVTVTTNVPAAAGQTQSVSLTIYQGTTTTPANQIAFGTAGTYRQRLRGLLPGERHVHDRGRPVRRGHGHDLRSDLLGFSGQPAS